MASGGLITCCLGAVILRPLAFLGWFEAETTRGRVRDVFDPFCCYQCM